MRGGGVQDARLQPPGVPAVENSMEIFYIHDFCCYKTFKTISCYFFPLAGRFGRSQLYVHSEINVAMCTTVLRNSTVL